MTLRRLVLTIAIALAMSAQLMAAERSTTMQELQQTDTKLGQLAGQYKGTPQHRLLQEQQKVQRLIDDLHAGRPVSAGDIDQVLDNANRNGAW